MESDEDPVDRTGVYVPSTGQVKDDDTFRIMVATDIHLGYCDNNPARENDSFDTFEEILQLAVKRQVDFLLLGGDLFHENKPRPKVLHRTTELLQKYCLGEKPVEFQYVGDPKRDFPNLINPEINYYNSNINIGLPVFTIHGNHDDPIHSGKTSAVDHLAAAKLLNHFGQWDTLNAVTISPVLLVKGQTKLALYGLGHMKDDRLHRAMCDNRVTFQGPEEESKSWFNLFVLHQNRVKHGPKSYIPESFIPGFINLVVWGHEHECRLRKDECTMEGVEPAEGLPATFIMQPGSSVATSLGAGEAEKKHVALVQINGRCFRVEPIELQTVRPFVAKDIMAKAVFEKLPKNATPKERSRNLEKYAEKYVDKMIEDSHDLLTGHPKQPDMPLIRLRIFHDDVDDTFNPIRFNQKFVEKVANDDIIIFKKTPVKREDGVEVDADEIGQMIMEQDDDDLDGHVETIVETYFANARAENKKSELLEVLSERGISDAVKCAVEKDDDKAIQVVIDAQMEKVIQYLIQKKVTEETVEDVVEEFTELRAKESEKERKEIEGILKNIKVKSRPEGSTGDDGDESAMDVNGHGENGGEESPEIIDDDDDEPSSTRGRGKKGASTRGRGRGATNTTSTRGRGRGSRSTKATTSRDDSSSPPPPSTSRGRGRSRGSSSSAASTSSTPRASSRTAKKDTSVAGKTLVQQTLNIRRSPRKGSQAMTFDDDDSD